MRKPKDQSLEEFVKSVPANHWCEIPIENVTKDEYKRMTAPNLATRFFKRMQYASNSELAVEAGGLMDKALLALLAKFSVNASKLDFSGKINRAHALGFVSDEDQHIMHVVRKVRNKFAHDPDLRHFIHDQEVVDLIMSLPHKSDDPAFEPGLDMRFRGMAWCVLMALERVQVSGVNPSNAPPTA